jgi:hypothetical protein
MCTWKIVDCTQYWQEFNLKSQNMPKDEISIRSSIIYKTKAKITNKKCSEQYFCRIKSLYIFKHTDLVCVGKF